MILKDNNNKFKKILILVFILVFILFYNSKSKALQLTSGTDYSIIESRKDFIDDNIDFQSLVSNYIDWNIYRDKTNSRIYYNNTLNPNYRNIAYGINLLDTYSNFNYNNVGITFNKYPSYVRNAFIFLSEGDLPFIPNITGDTASTFQRWKMRSNTIVISIGDLYSGSQANYITPLVYYFSTDEVFSYTTSKYYYYDITRGANDVYFKSNIKWNLNLNGTKYANSSFELETLSSSLLDFQETVITNRNIITGYDFRPKFDNFVPNLFKYQYGFGDSGYLEIEENEQLITVRGNGSFKVRIINLSDNSVMYYNYDIINIGSIYDENFDYSIKFDTQNNTDGNNIIDNVSIYTMFYPISSFFTYEYQFVLEDNDIDDNAWLNINYNDIDEGLPFTYVANNNGTLYVRIKYDDGSVKIQDSYVVDNLGLFTLGANSGQINNSFDKFRRIIDFGSPIGSFIVIPINLMQTLFDSVNNSSGVCNDYSLGSLYGYELHLPCVDVKRYLGNDLYSIIDMIVSCCIIYNLLNMLMNAYYNFLSMQKDPISSGDLVDELRRR